MCIIGSNWGCPQHHRLIWRKDAVPGSSDTHLVKARNGGPAYAAGSHISSDYESRSQGFCQTHV